MQHEDITEIIIGCAMKVHRTLGPGFLESVYQKALTHELQKADLHVQCETRLQVHYDGKVVGDFIADMLVEHAVIVENKSVQQMNALHEVQLVNYLTATKYDIGLLINFGASSLQFKRKVRQLQKG